MADFRQVWPRLHLSHLRSDGLLVLNLFDPRYELLLPGECPPIAPLRSLIHPTSRNRVTTEVLQRVNHVLHQCLSETWRFMEFGPDETTVLRQEEGALRLRRTFRQEMRHLLRICGFRVVAEYSDKCHLRTTVKNRFGLSQNRFEMIADTGLARRR